MKYNKFEGSLGDFLESYVKDDISFYVYYKNYVDPLEIHGSNLKALVDTYNQGVYTEKQEVWTDRLPALCKVSNNSFQDTLIVLVVGFEEGCYYSEQGYNYRQATPLTQEEVDKFIWKGSLLIKQHNRTLT